MKSEQFAHVPHSHPSFEYVEERCIFSIRLETNSYNLIDTIVQILRHQDFCKTNYCTTVISSPTQAINYQISGLVYQPVMALKHEI